MARKYNNSAQIGKTKKSTDDMIQDAIARQNSWVARRSAYAKKFLGRLNIFAKSKNEKNENRGGVLKAYWFPILCAIIVLMIGAWVLISRDKVVVPNVPAPVVVAVSEKSAPSFDIVRIDPNGNIVIAGRHIANRNVSIIINKKMIATVATDVRGELVYTTANALAPGNYTVSLVSENGVKSENKVFLYISEHGVENSISLLMTNDGSTLLQSPNLVHGDLAVSKIDYLDTGRIVVTGDALPRLRVSLSLDDKYIGFARTSDHKHFGIGADVEKLEPGREYSLAVRLHDGDGTTVATIEHKFVMPEMTGDDDTYYTVRRGDCLWIIARNFLRRGVLFSIIAERNNIENPNLIFPKQLLQIPTKGN